MKVRKVVIFTGKRFEVPQCIQRIDHLATHGWQMRYGGTRAVAKAIKLREEAEEVYRLEATKAKRAAGRRLKEKQVLRAVRA